MTHEEMLKTPLPELVEKYLKWKESEEKSKECMPISKIRGEINEYVVVKKGSVKLISNDTISLQTVDGFSFKIILDGSFIRVLNETRGNKESFLWKDKVEDITRNVINLMNRSILSL